MMKGIPMQIAISNNLRDTIRTVLEDVERNEGILDAYKAAEDIQTAYPEENVALEDIIAALMTGRGSIQAIEFNPRNTVIEIVYPVDDEEESEQDVAMPAAS
jgi:hypothetical protein